MGYLVSHHNLNQDDETNDLVTIDQAHHEIHEGHHFKARHCISS